MQSPTGDGNFPVNAHKNAGRAAALAAAAATLLAITKVGLYFYTGSLVVAVSAVDSSMDVIVSLLNRKAIILARQNPDKGHPYGHGKAESMAALAQGALLIGASLAIAGSAVQVLYRGFFGDVEIPDISMFAIVFFVFAAMLSLLITLSLKRAARLHHSPALTADAAHYESDVLANLASAAGLAAVYLTDIAWLDPAIAILFATKIAHSGFGLLRTSVDELMDHDIGEDLKEEVERFAKTICTDIVDLHKFRGRRSGHRYLFDFHVTLPAELSFLQVHERVDALEDAIRARFNADAVIHADPTGLANHKPKST